MASLTVYPAVDGYVYRSGAAQTWASIRDGAGTGNGATDANYLTIAQLTGGGTTTWTVMVRAIATFDVSALPVGYIVSAATITVFGRAKQDPATAIAPDANVYEANPVSNTALQNADYGNILTTPFCNTPITYANFAVDADGNPPAPNDFILNASGIAEIQTPTSGYSRFGFRNASYDVVNSEPVSHSATTDAQILPFPSEWTGTGNDPKLVITYTVASNEGSVSFGADF